MLDRPSDFILVRSSSPAPELQRVSRTRFAVRSMPRWLELTTLVAVLVLVSGACWYLGDELLSRWKVF